MASKLAYPRGLAAAAALVFVVPGCSLLFESSASPVGGIDGGPVGGIDGGPGEDATTANCGPSLSGTLALFHINGDNHSDSIEDFLGGPPGQGVAVSFPPEGGQELSPTPLTTTSGPGSCKTAVRLTNRSNPFVWLPYDIVEEVRGLDFWFQTDGVTSPGGRGALLTKDGNGALLGDLGLFVVRTPAETGTHHVVMRLQDPNRGNYFVCSGELPVGDWHRETTGPA